MILVIDVGNTNLVLGAFEEDKNIALWRLSTDYKKTSDEYGATLLQLFNHANLNPENVEGVIISSVVPNIMYTLENMVRKFFKVKAQIFGKDIPYGMDIRIDNPNEVGADRIVNAIAAHEIYKKPLIILDFGTATTFCAINGEGAYLGGAICPGMKIAAQALFEKTAKLPDVKLEEPKSVIATNTIEGIQSGIVNGYVGQVEYIVTKMKEEMMAKGEEEPFVVATGGLATLIDNKTEIINEINPFLTLEGLKIIYKKNKAGGNS